MMHFRKAVRTGTLFVMFLTIASQMVHAQDLCKILDKVVDAAQDDPPFTSVMHLSVPHSTICEVVIGPKFRNSWFRAGWWKAKKVGWGCLWQQLAKDARIHGHAKAMVFSITQCFSDKAIRGDWRSFKYFDHDSASLWHTISSDLSMGIMVYANEKDRKVYLDIYK